MERMGESNMGLEKNLNWDPKSAIFINEVCFLVFIVYIHSNLYDVFLIIMGKTIFLLLFLAAINM